MTTRLTLYNGARCGRLSVVEPDAARRQHWRCLCDCGSEVVVLTWHLRSGHTTSCGCAVVDKCIELRRTHGHASRGKESRTYVTWRSMRQRCSDKNTKSFERYGTLGVEVCARWGKFENFLSDMGESPSPDHSIDRWPDASGNYEPNNCRWATRSQQARNKRRSFLVEYEGAVVPLADACEQVGQSYSRVFQRIYKLGWPVARALTQVGRTAA